MTTWAETTVEHRDESWILLTLCPAEGFSSCKPADVTSIRALMQDCGEDDTALTIKHLCKYPHYLPILSQYIAIHRELPTDSGREPLAPLSRFIRTITIQCSHAPCRAVRVGRQTSHNMCCCTRRIPVNWPTWQLQGLSNGLSSPTSPQVLREFGSIRFHFSENSGQMRGERNPTARPTVGLPASCQEIQHFLSLYQWAHVWNG